ncbi:uncharacterized protein ZAP3 [Venturia canescens]|uniref:uncharacterized protein ZAP3 n=1 Tax=Venturia canescens TaxID=32260 RepID=UPI001C9C4D63|nr:uncharacterized protein LOC122415807 [Venturia canescens]
MQNWNQWQLPATSTVTAPMPQPPIGYAAPGADPMAVMQSFMQYYNQPAPNGYTAEQWAAAQQQNWAQWQTWQQQYQQWQAQYGEKYQETMKQMQGFPNLSGQLPATTTLPSTAQPPPLPKEDTSAKPPLPPESSSFGYPGVPPPPHQNNLPLFPSNKSTNPPLPPGQPPLPPDSSRKNSSTDNTSSGKRTANSTVESVSAKKIKVDDEELTEAEKTFDAQFKQWEEQFNKWKLQNANHPDKAQYKQYEAKWTSWRAKLIERREQMRRKREQQKIAAAKAEAEKEKENKKSTVVGDDKILNLLTNTENQGLINNLLGIGKTLGLTGKNEGSQEQAQAPVTQPAAPAAQPLPIPPSMNPAAWAAQQWAAQYTAGTNMMNYVPNFQQPQSVPQLATNPLPTTMPMPNFSQPPNFVQPPTNFNQPPPGAMGATQNFSGPSMPPNMSGGGPNFSQPPPGFGSSNQQQLGDSNSGHRAGNFQDQTIRPFGSEGEQRSFPEPVPGAQYKDSMSASNDTNRFNFDTNRFSGPPPSNLGGMISTGRDGPDNRQDNCARDFGPAGRSGNEFRPSGDSFGSSFDNDQQSGNRFIRNNEKQPDAFGNNRGSSDRDSFNPDRFGGNSDRFNMRNDRFNSSNDHFGPNKDSFSSNMDRFPSANDQFNSDNDQFRSRNDQFGGMSGDRFGMCGDRSGNNNFGGSLNDKFNRPAPDRFDSRDNSRDSGNSNFRNYGKSNQFTPANDMPPELQKLMDKRRAAMDVFKPSNFSSFLDSTKSFSSSTSLSESFRKLTGDSPFLSRSSLGFGKDMNSGPRGSTFGTSASNVSNFESSRDNRPANNSNFNFRGSGGEFAPRGSGNFRPRGNEFAPRDSGEFNYRDFRDFGPPANEFLAQEDAGPDHGAKNSGNSQLRPGNDFEQRGTEREFEDNSQNKQQRDNYGLSDKQDAGTEQFEGAPKPPTREDPPMKPMDTRNEKSDSQENKLQSDSIRSNEDPNLKSIPPLQVPSWIEAEFANDDFNETLGEKQVEKGEEETAAIETSPKDASKDDRQPTPNSELPSRADNEESKDQAIVTDKKPDDLPFMGENDPKPEDLNMEPPPELPNLGPAMKDPEENWKSNEGENMNEPSERGPHSDNARKIDFDAPFGPSPMHNQSRDATSFGSRDMGGRAGPADNMRPPLESFGSHRFGDGTRDPHPDSFEPRGPFGPRGPGGNFGPRGPGGDFGSRGPGGDFGPRGPGGNFGPRGPSGDFGPRGPPGSDFGFRAPGGDFGPRGPGGDFGPRGPGGDFGPRGPVGDFGPRGPGGDFGPRGPGGDFGPRGPGGDFGPRGPDGVFGLRGPGGDFGPRGPSDFGPRNLNDRSFGPRGASSSFGPCGPLNRPFGPFDTNNSPFPDNPPFGSNTFGPRGHSDNPAAGIPSLMSFKFDKPMNPMGDMPAHKGNEPNTHRWGDLPPAFRKPDEEQRGEERSMMDRGPAPGANTARGPDWRDAFGRNQFGDSDQRPGPPNLSKAPETRPGDQITMDKDRNQSGPGNHGRSLPPFGADGMIQNIDKPDRIGGGLPFEEPSRGPVNNENIRPGGSNFTSRRSNEINRIEGPKDFCVEKQYNYNHGTGKPDDMTAEHLPGNMIDYGHAPRVIVHDYVTPSQSYDYDHGRLKPVVSDHEIYCKRDFRNWIENEQNLREYTDRMRVYEADMRALKRGIEQRNTRVDARPHYWGERDRMQNDRRSSDHDRRPPINRNDRARRDREIDNYRDREHKGAQRDSRERGRNERDREWERTLNKQREDRTQHRRSRSKDRTRERPEKIRKETIKENKKDDERSKGNVADSESSAKKPDESTFPDNSNKHKADDDEPAVLKQIPEVSQAVEAAPPQTVDPPVTMELPKTPNFTMIDDLLCLPGRQNRPPKIVVILRGPPGSGKSFVAKLIKDKEVEQGGSAPRILSLDDYFLTEKEIESEDGNGKKTTTKDMVYEYEEAMEPSYITSLVKAFKKNITDGFFNFIILDSINEKISDYEEMWSFAKTKGFRVYVCEMEMDVQVCLKRNIHNRTEEEINRIVDYFEPTPSYHQKLDVTSMLQEEAIEEVHMEDSQEVQPESTSGNDDSQDSQEDPQASAGVSKWEIMEAEDKLDRLDGLAKRKNDGKPQTMEDFLQVAEDYNTDDTSGKRRVRWADLEERKEQEKMRAVGFVVGQTNWDRMMDPTNGGSALTRTKFFPPS